jgi:hypothetical protein
MKLIESFIEKSLTSSKKILSIQQSITLLLKDVKDLYSQLEQIIHLVNQHNDYIVAISGVLNKTTKENTLDLSFSSPNKVDNSKPN